MTKRDYYQILGVNKNSSEKEIKDAYRKLALKWHPDRNADKREEAEGKMREINQAYGVLGDKEKKKNYDRYGAADDSFGQGNDFYDSRASSFFEDILGSFGFDQDMNFGGKKYSSSNFQEFGPKSGKDLLFSLNLSFKESVLGAKKKISFSVERVCSDCNQTGAYSASDIVNCSDCQGRGFIHTNQRTILGTIRSQATCPRCKGKGKNIKKKCEKCSGNKFNLEKEVLEVNIPRGISIEQKLRYGGVGNDGLNGGRKGDVYISIRVMEDNYFQRKGNDIHVSLPISFLDAILGSQVELITIEGIEKIAVPSGTQVGDNLILKEKGCFVGINKSARGNFYVWFQIKLPKKITKSTEEVLRSLKSSSNWNPNKEFIEKNS
jgi:molecular chaperone DnaJ